jgi:hypothetical protein
MEREWQTKNWVLRLFMTILGIIIVNSFNAYLYLTTTLTDQMDFNTFLGKLSYQLIHNDFLREGERQLRRRDGAVQQFEDDNNPHVAALLSSHPSYAHVKNTSSRARRRCKICKSRTAWYCVQCSEKGGFVLSYCYGNSGKTCFSQHF